MAEGYRYQEHGISTGSVLFCQRAAEINDGDLIVVKENGAFALYRHIEMTEPRELEKLTRLIIPYSPAFNMKRPTRDFDQPQRFAR